MERESDTMTSTTSTAGLTLSPPMSKWIRIYVCVPVCVCVSLCVVCVFVHACFLARQLLYLFHVFLWYFKHSKQGTLSDRWSQRSVFVLPTDPDYIRKLTNERNNLNTHNLDTVKFDVGEEKREQEEQELSLQTHWEGKCSLRRCRTDIFQLSTDIQSHQVFMIIITNVKLHWSLWWNAPLTTGRPDCRVSYRGAWGCLAPLGLEPRCFSVGIVSFLAPCWI